MRQRESVNSGSCLISDSGLDEFRPRPPSLAGTSRRSGFYDDDSDSEISARSNGRPSMQHPTVVHGDVTR